MTQELLPVAATSSGSHRQIIAHADTAECIFSFYLSIFFFKTLALGCTRFSGFECCVYVKKKKKLLQTLLSRRSAPLTCRWLPVLALTRLLHSLLSVPHFSLLLIPCQFVCVCALCVILESFLLYSTSPCLDSQFILSAFVSTWLALSLWPLKKKPLFKSEYFKMKHPLSIIWKLLLFIVKLFLVCRTANWSHFTATVCPFSSSLIVLSDFAALMASLLCQKAASLAVCLQSSHRNTHSLETVNTRLEMEMLQGSAIYSILIQWLLSNAY